LQLACIARLGWIVQILLHFGWISATAYFDTEPVMP